MAASKITMKTSIFSFVGVGALFLGGLIGSAAVTKPTAPAKPKVDFDRDVRPIISENCFACHGPDTSKRLGGLRLDTPDGIYKKLDSGNIAVVPNNPKASALWQRVSAKSAIQMPPPTFNKHLTSPQIATLKAWIEQGGHYAQHWAFVKPVRPALPAVKHTWWARNPIDKFLLARMEQNGLCPSPEADKATLIRRVTFDLTGMPPTLPEIDAFLADKSPDAYEKVVDRLLASPRYGERMALAWLDLARYADTHGYHIDSQRDMWRWRDWVIDAYNRNLPYDQFTVQQLAGDLLPNATLDQKIATGFNRNHPIDFEGGAIPEEYAAAYIFDRIDTTSTTFLGLTMRCAQCHDHKYDPLTQKEYYKFYAFFNNVPELGLDGQKGNAVPFIKAPLPGQDEQLKSYGAMVSELDKAVKARTTEAAPMLASWEKTALTSSATTPTLANGLAAQYSLDEGSGTQVKDALGKQPVGTINGKADWGQGKVGGAIKLDGATYVDLGSNFGFDRTDKASYGAWVYPTSADSMTVISRMDDANGIRGWDMFMGGGTVFVHMINKWESNAIRINTKAPIELNKWHHLFVTYDGSSKAKGVKLYVDGKKADVDVTHDTLKDTIKADKPVLIGRRNPSGPFKGMIDEVRLYNRELSAAEVEQLAGFDTIRNVLTVAADKRTPEQKDTLAKYYLTNYDEPYKKLNTELADWRKKYTDFDNAIPTTMVMQEMEKPRDTFMLVRGQYDQKGEKVTPDVPKILGTSIPKEAPANRLALAKWLVDPDNPLTARVAVNRYWQMYFGTGIVKTAENFGTQGDAPSNPGLLDWLATEFIRTGWDVKGMQRLIVTSAAYRQTSKATPESLEKDPENRFLARGSRYRLPAEMIRDQALSISGLFVGTIGGPSVKPYQPAGLWEEISFGGGFSAQTYVQDHGDALYRRSMYTFWKRTCPPPSLQTFDAPEREFCMVRRSVTNTPLQALIVMNDPTYVEASRKLAERILTEAPASPKERINFVYRLAMARPAKEAELKVLLGVLNQQLVRFNNDNAAAMKLLTVGESKRNEKLNPAELAAWTSVASMILNLDETMTKG
jgi:hypothetical protein